MIIEQNKLISKENENHSCQVNKHNECSHDHHNHQHQYEGKAKAVVYLTAIAMIFEIGFGYFTKSMALLTDGWHMASHVFAIGLCWIAYYYERKNRQNTNFKNGTSKIFPLAGYSSALILVIISITMAIESVERIIHPKDVLFQEAIIVSIIGLIVNAISAKYLHHDHTHSDANIKAAYIHVLADLLTSIAAIIALVAGYIFNILYLDSLIGIFSSLVILKWGLGLLINSGKEILDFSTKHP